MTTWTLTTYRHFKYLWLWIPVFHRLTDDDWTFMWLNFTLDNWSRN